MNIPPWVLIAAIGAFLLAVGFVAYQNLETANLFVEGAGG